MIKNPKNSQQKVELNIETKKIFSPKARVFNFETRTSRGAIAIGFEKVVVIHHAPLFLARFIGYSPAHSCGSIGRPLARDGS